MSMFTPCLLPPSGHKGPNNAALKVFAFKEVNSQRVILSHSHSQCEGLKQISNRLLCSFYFPLFHYYYSYYFFYFKCLDIKSVTTPTELYIVQSISHQLACVSLRCTLKLGKV